MIPGILKGVEVFKKGEKLMVIHNCQITDFEKVTVDLKKYFESFVDERALRGLELLKIEHKDLRLKKFLECRYGNFDLFPDFEGECTVLEYSNCPDKDQCPALGLICSKKIGDLTQREVEVAVLIGEDLPDKQIADRLNISYTTAVTHRRNIEKKLHSGSKVGVARSAIEHNLVIV